MQNDVQRMIKRLELLEKNIDRTMQQLEDLKSDNEGGKYIVFEKEESNEN